MRKFIDEVEIENSKYIRFLVLPYWDDFEVLADIIEKKIKAKAIKKKDGVYWRCNTYNKDDIYFDLYYNEDLDGNFLRGIEPSLFTEKYISLRLLAKEILNKLDLTKFKYRYYQEIDDILRLIQWQRLIISKVNGSLILFYKNLIPESLNLSQINEKVSGIVFKNISLDRKINSFNFKNSSIYNLFSELEAIWNYVLNNDLLIEKIEILLYFENIKFYKQNVDNEKYNSIVKKEINDLKNSIKIECGFSGSLFIEYAFQNLTTNKLDQNSGEYPSIYSFLMDFERQLRGKKNLKEFEIKLTLNKL